MSSSVFQLWFESYKNISIGTTYQQRKTSISAQENFSVEFYSTTV